MPSAQLSWQVRCWVCPSTVARHSKQIPIPQTGPRSSPWTERLKPARVVRIAAATVVPACTFTSAPSMVIFTKSGMGRLAEPCREIRGDRNFVARPLKSADSSSAVASEVVMPRPSCPVARKIVSSPGHGPMSGSLSGVAARWPVQVRMMEQEARPGMYSTARASMRPENGVVNL